MSTYRVHRHRRYTITPNDIIERGDISWQATGLLTYLLSRPDDWRPKGDHLATVKTNGKHSTMSARRELIDIGYLVEDRRRDPASGQISTTTHVFDTPGHTVDEVRAGPENPPESENRVPVATSGNAGEPRPGFPDDGNPDSGQPNPGEASSLPITDQPITDQETLLHPASGARNGDTNGDDPLYVQFSEAYPRGHDNGRLLGGAAPKKVKAKWRRMTVADRQAAVIGVANYAAEINAKPGAYVAFATTWLNEERWEMYQRPPKPLPANDRNVPAWAQGGTGRLVG